MVTIYLSYTDGNGTATLKWEENTDVVPDFERKHGAKPNQWYDSYQIHKTDFGNWNDRHLTPCNEGRLVELGDRPFAAKRLGPRVLHFRITVVNPPNCHCGHFEVQVTAVQTIDPQKEPGLEFSTPDPNPPGSNR